MQPAPRTSTVPLLSSWRRTLPSLDGGYVILLLFLSLLLLLFSTLYIYTYRFSSYYTFILLVNLSSLIRIIRFFHFFFLLLLLHIFRLFKHTKCRAFPYSLCYFYFAFGQFSLLSFSLSFIYIFLFASKLRCVSFYCLLGPFSVSVLHRHPAGVNTHSVSIR